jgi:hypothetical protein
MTDDREQLDVIETALLELEAADAAGAFERTSVDGRSILAVGPDAARTTLSARRRALRVVLRSLPVAAALALVVGVWGWMFSAELSRISGQVNFQKCFGGPTSARMTECSEHDYDADGDVDLADFSAYQLAFAGESS